jgi:hypothetical protein
MEEGQCKMDRCIEVKYRLEQEVDAILTDEGQCESEILTTV